MKTRKRNRKYAVIVSCPAEVRQTIEVFAPDESSVAYELNKNELSYLKKENWRLENVQDDEWEICGVKCIDDVGDDIHRFLSNECASLCMDDDDDVKALVRLLLTNGFIEEKK